MNSTIQEKPKPLGPQKPTTPVHVPNPDTGKKGHPGIVTPRPPQKPKR